MTDTPELPKGIHLAEDQSTAPITETQSLGGSKIDIRQPQMVGIPVQVQHPSNAGKPAPTGPGMVGFGILLTPDGQGNPAIMLSLKHSDGTSLAGILTIVEFLELTEITDSVIDQLVLMRRATEGQA